MNVYIIVGDLLQRHIKYIIYVWLMTGIVRRFHSALKPLWDSSHTSLA